jgi:hypothetical protein
MIMPGAISWINAVVKVWIVLFGLIVVIVVDAEQNDNQQEDDEFWRQCHLFLAPSTMGWGVFAGRDFQKGEIVEFSPLVLPTEPDSPIVRNTQLDDYIYGYYRLDGSDLQTLNAILLGNGMYFNHHAEQNINYVGLSREPSKEFPNASNVVGYVANRDIAAGEELLSTYGREDGGKRWFQDRKIELKLDPTNATRISPEALPRMMEEYCGQIYSGVGVETYSTGVKPILPQPGEVPYDLDLLKRLYKLDSGVGNARSKGHIAAGRRIEIAPAMLLDSRIVEGTVIEKLTYPFGILSPDQQEAIRKLQKENNNDILVQYQGSDTHYQRMDRFQGFELTTIFPAAGQIGMVRRVTDEKASNCRLVIHSKGLEGAVGLTLELIASKDIEPGDILQLLMGQAGGDWATFESEMQLTGQRYYWDGLTSTDDSSSFSSDEL